MNASRLLTVLAMGCSHLALTSAHAVQRPGKTYDFPIYTNAPSGQQLSGQHAPASTPALTPEQARSKFTLPPGFEIRIFAYEPEVVNPVAMTWDDRGRLWVVELYEYPLGAKPGQKPRDRIKILEDVDSDGTADKVTVFADGLNLATGILLGNGGVYVGQAPHLLFLKDTDGDDKADTREVLLTGFGLEDRHELLNGFTWGPDGQIYMTHGVFTRSQVGDPRQTGGDTVLYTAGVARMDPRTRRFEVFAEGTSNPWGVDFDRNGQAFVSACVIEHMFHMAPGGLYDRQAGTPPHPYAYELLHSINDHKHHMAAYAGVQVYQGNQYPVEYQGTILQGNIHDNAVHQDSLTQKGSSYVAGKIRDLVRANDGWFMPVSTQVGPDGAVWIMDWYDRYPCYQNANADPEGVDREYGRIWRVVHVGDKPGKPVASRPDPTMNLARLTGDQLVAMLSHPNIWQRRHAQRLLQERGDAGVKPALERAVGDIKAKMEYRLAALWTLHAAQLLDNRILDSLVEDKEPAIRSWVARLTGERRVVDDGSIERLEKMARDASPEVRMAVGVASRLYASDRLTVNTPPRNPNPAIGGVLTALIKASAAERDPVIPFMIWHAAEPGFSANPQVALDWLLEEGQNSMPLAGTLAYKAMRRLSDMNRADALDRAVAFIRDASDKGLGLTAFALDGLVQGQEGKTVVPTSPTGPFLEKLLKSSDVKIVEYAQKLGARWGDAAALKSALATLRDSALPHDKRIAALQALRKSRSPEVRAGVLEMVKPTGHEAFDVELVRAFKDVAQITDGDVLVRNWKSYSAPVRRVAAETLASRQHWMMALLNGIERKEIATTDLSATVMRTITNTKEAALQARVAQVIGRFRESSADKAKIVAEKRRMVLEGVPDLAAGHEVAKRTCFVCHKLHGEGVEVGPDLTGVGRSSLDALLWNIIDPNQVIGAGYENVEIETKDGTTYSGRVVESNDSQVKLRMIGGREEVIARSDIGTMKTSENSVMPEGLDQLPEADFRNLIWYILSPPQEGALTPEKKKALSGAGGGHATLESRRDGESVALWNPEWKVVAPDFEGTPRKLPEFAGHHNVLETHPFDRDRGSIIERRVEIPAGKKATLKFAVASHEQGNWTLRVKADGRVLHEQQITSGGKSRWETVRVDLTGYAGRTVHLQLENVANDWHFEFAYWSDLALEVASVK